MKFDLARRVAMKAILGSPVAAKGVVDAAAAKALGWDHGPDDQPSPAVEGLTGVVGGNACDPLHDLFYRHQQSVMARINSRRQAEVQHHMPLDVATKKSWSPAFKAHVTRQQMEELLMWDDFRDEGKIRALVSIGVLPKSLLGED